MEYVPKYGTDRVTDATSYKELVSCVIESLRQDAKRFEISKGYSL